MKAFFRAIFPAEFYERPEYFRGFSFGLLYTFFLVMQLFTFEKFPDVISAYGLRLSGLGVAVFLTFVEAAALPFLFSMRLPRPARVMSRLAVFVTAFAWLLLAVILNARGYEGNAGIFGGTLESTNGWWFVVFTGLIALTAVLIVWELPMRASVAGKNLK